MCTALTIFASGSYAAEHTIQYRGEAYDRSSGRLLYIEQHKEYWQENQHVYSDVLYLGPDGRTMAYKRITFSQSRISPRFRLEDYRNGYVEGAEIQSGGLFLFSRPGGGENLAGQIIENDGRTVVDGGFDYYIRLNWDSLMRGAAQQVRFAVPHKMDAFRFLLLKTGEYQNGGRTCAIFRLRIDNAILRLLVDDIEVAYDVQLRRLVRYSGISNINDVAGKSYRTNIIFNYSHLNLPEAAR